MVILSGSIPDNLGAFGTTTLDAELYASLRLLGFGHILTPLTHPCFFLLLADHTSDGDLVPLFHPFIVDWIVYQDVLATVGILLQFAG